MVNDMTKSFSRDENVVDIKKTLLFVKEALEEKGYNYKNQISGFLVTGDPSYIPRYNNARNLIKAIERDLIIEELLEKYLEDDE